MSDTTQGPGWWLASDGRWYPPHLAPGAADGSWAGPGPGWDPYRTAPSTVSPQLALALRIVFWIMVGVSAIRLLMALVGWIAYASFHGDPSRSSYDRWRTVDGVTNAWGLLVTLTALALLVLVIVWSWQAHRTVTDLGARPSWRIGWTIGAWFACCAAIILPKLVLDAIEKGALAPRHGGRVTARWDVRPTAAIGWVWWVALVGSFVRFTYSTNDARRDALTDSGFITSAYVVAVLAAICAIVAALAGRAYFQRMSDRLTPAGLDAHRED